MATRKPIVTVKGLDGAQAIMQMAAITSSVDASASWVSDPREPYAGVSDKNTPTNLEIINYQAGMDKNGRPSASHKGPTRSILPTDADETRMAELFSTEIVKKMNQVGKTVTRGGKGGKPKVTTVLSQKKQAKAGIASGLRKAANYQAETMYERLKRGGFEGVGESYAAWRRKQFGVGDGAVLIASRQLAEALQDGKIKITIATGKIAKAVKSIAKF